jgi:muramoyltetrapeptide carboxypeptidase
VDAVSWEHVFSGDAAWSLGVADGLRVLRAGIAGGKLDGGCLSIYVESLGTPYAALPPSEGEPRILFLEDIGTKPYQWDRRLLHLRYAGMLEHVSGIVFGDMRQSVAPEEDALLEAAILHSLRDFSGPITIGLRCGHVDTPNIALPLGVRVRLDASETDAPRMDFPEAATTSS